MHDTPALFIVGCIRSGTTVLHQTLMQCCPRAVDLDDLDFECRTFWHRFGCRMGSPSTGTRCLPAGAEIATDEARATYREYCAERTSGGRHILNKNPHLSNKILFLHALDPNARFVHIIREPFATVASTKLRFEAAFRSDNRVRLPFVHYWPDSPYACWYAIPANATQTPEKLRRFRHRVRLQREPGRAGIRSYVRRLIFPPRMLPGAIPHEEPDAFRREFPDESRYYPGQGFARIPEAWVRINANVVRQLDKIPTSRWMHVSYDELCADTHGVLERIVRFAGIGKVELQTAPRQLDLTTRDKWQVTLSEAEKSCVGSILEGRKEDMRLLRECAPDIPTSV